MSLEKRILNKQNDRLKTNLAQQKVELAAPEFKKFGQKAQSIYLDARTQAQKELMNLRDSLDKGDRKLISLENELNALISKVESSAKGIGVDIYSTKVGQNIKSAKSEVEQYTGSFQKAITRAKGLKL